MLRCENLTKKYIRKTAVSNLNLQLAGGKIYALLGPNGSGKSTLMKMIVGITKPSSGMITLDEEPISYRTKAKVAYMPTEAYFFSYMTCEDIGKYYADFFEDFDFNTYVRLIAEMDLDMRQKAREMSSGMIAKLKIAVNLSRRAEVVLLDEPLNGIDIIAREKIIHTIISNVSNECAVVISSHLVDELEKIVDYAIFLKEGECVLADSAEGIREKHGKSIVDMYKQIYA